MERLYMYMKLEKAFSNYSGGVNMPGIGLPLPKRRMPIPTKVEGVLLSVQGSEMHYCSPRENLDSLDKYKELEIALVKEKGGFLSLSEVAPQLTDKGMEADFEMNGGVYTFVPRKKVVEIVSHLIEK